jgi:3-dehydroquinate dehydratase I
MSPKSPSDMLEGVKKAEQLGADFSEVRLERLDRLVRLSDVVEAARKPLIATNRFLAQNEPNWKNEMIIRAVEEGFQYVDLDIESPDLEQTINHIRKKGGRIILSHHDHKGTPAPHELTVKLKEFQRHSPEICKIVTTANHIDDNLRILEFIRENHHSMPLVSFAMGSRGILSRLLAPLYGAEFTYASLDKGLETALGQTPIDEMQRIYKTLEADS